MGSAAYLNLRRRGKLGERVETASCLLDKCSICPRKYGVDRRAGETGKCRTSREAMVCSCGSHFGEEPAVVDSYGSETMLFANYSVRCLFCQNYSIGQLGEGEKVTKEELAYIMLLLQSKGCHNSDEISRNTHINVTARYRLGYRACQISGLGQLTLTAEYHDLLCPAREAGLTRLDRIRFVGLLPAA